MGVKEGGSYLNLQMKQAAKYDPLHKVQGATAHHGTFLSPI